MSRKPYECFKCRDSGYPNTMVYLAGKDDTGRTIQLEEDGTKHIHKQAKREEESTTVVTAEPTPIMKIINAKLDRIIALLEGQHQQQQQMKN